jgi:hypothetical protein
MLDHGYFFRQIRILLKFARLTSDPLFAAFLMEKAVKLKSQADRIPPPPEVSPLPPDVELVKESPRPFGAGIDGRINPEV